MPLTMRAQSFAVATAAIMLFTTMDGRLKAEECCALAEIFRDGDGRAQMLLAAAHYEHLAALFERIEEDGSLAV